MTDFDQSNGPTLEDQEDPIPVRMVGRNPENPKSRKTGEYREQTIEAYEEGICGTITTVQKDNLVIEQRARGFNKGGSHSICPPITSNSFEQNNLLRTEKRIRRLTPRECFRLQGFPDSFDISKVSDTQGYKQAGNTITVKVIKEICRNLESILL
jgi:DNA (cytosine-5)-methyltransferase 1